MCYGHCKKKVYILNFLVLKAVLTTLVNKVNQGRSSSDSSISQTKRDADWNNPDVAGDINGYALCGRCGGLFIGARGLNVHLSYGTKCIGVSRGSPVQPENQQDGDNDEDVFYTPPEGSPPQENAVAIPPCQNRFGMTYLLGILSCMSIFALYILFQMLCNISSEKMLLLSLYFKSFRLYDFIFFRSSRRLDPQLFFKFGPSCNKSAKVA
ncbi:hypothetical protein EDC94DRAFT_579954 [Helicostylum pulchrum]|nr:hypothetical protein EDC94DRAFT_579954 [Helicostylum pulchrum]